jgi:hypothetical protein
MLHQPKRRCDVDPTVCSHSTDVISQKGLYDCDARVVHEQIQRIPSYVMDEIGNTGWHGKIMNQADHMRAVVVQRLAHFRQRDGIAPMEKQFNIRTCQFFGNRAANSAARTCDEITLHLCG